MLRRSKGGRKEPTKPHHLLLGPAVLSRLHVASWPGTTRPPVGRKNRNSSQIVIQGKLVRCEKDLHKCTYKQIK